MWMQGRLCSSYLSGKISERVRNTSVSSAQLHKKPARAPLARELAVLFWRTLTEILRNPTLLLMHCLMALIMGLLCGGIFYHISNDIAGAQNRLGMCHSSHLPACIACCAPSPRGASLMRVVLLTCL